MLFMFLFRYIKGSSGHWKQITKFDGSPGTYGEVFINKSHFNRTSYKYKSDYIILRVILRAIFGHGPLHATIGYIYLLHIYRRKLNPLPVKIRSPHPT